MFNIPDPIKPNFDTTLALPLNSLRYADTKLNISFKRSEQSHQPKQSHQPEQSHQSEQSQIYKRNEQTPCRPIYKKHNV